MKLETCAQCGATVLPTQEGRCPNCQRKMLVDARKHPPECSDPSAPTSSTLPERRFEVFGYRDRARNPRYKGIGLLGEEGIFLAMPRDAAGKPKRFDRIPVIHIFFGAIGCSALFVLVVLALEGGGVLSKSAATTVLGILHALLLIPAIAFGLYTTRRAELDARSALEHEFSEFVDIRDSGAPLEDALSFLADRAFSIDEHAYGDLDDIVFSTPVWRGAWRFWRRMRSKRANLNWLITRAIADKIQILCEDRHNLAGG